VYFQREKSERKLGCKQQYNCVSTQTQLGLLTASLTATILKLLFIMCIFISPEAASQKTSKQKQR